MFRIGIWNCVFGALLAASIGNAFAGDRSPQEEAALVSMRQNYIRAIGSTPTPEDEQKMLAEWKASVIRDAARITAVPVATQSAPNVGAAAPSNLPAGVPSNLQQMMQAAMLRAQNGGIATPVSNPVTSTASMGDAELLQ